MFGCVYHVAHSTRVRRGFAALACLDSPCASLQELLYIVDRAPELITRFFRHNTYSEVECRLVIDLLTSEKYGSYDALPAADRENVAGACRRCE